MDDSYRYERARRRVRQLREFYTHLTVYLLVNAGLFLLNLLTSPSELWFQWPLLGWGIGVAIHALVVFGAGRWLGPEWEERQGHRLMEKE